MGRANCDYGRGACTERTRSSTGKNWDYSVQHQFAAEVALLGKFMQMPRQPRDPHEADLLVVPWLAATDLASSRHRHWNPHNQLSKARFKRLRAQLAHFDSAPRRHVFLSTRDHFSTITPLRALVRRSGVAAPSCATAVLVRRCSLARTRRLLCAS